MLCAETGEKLIGGRYSVLFNGRGEIERWAIKDFVLREGKLRGGRYSVVCLDRGEKVRWDVQCCVLRDGRY